MSFSTRPCMSGQTGLAAHVAVGKPLMAEAQQVQDRGVEVVARSPLPTEPSEGSHNRKTS